MLASIGAARARLRELIAPLLLLLACLLVYNANLRQIGAGDSLSARYLPLLLWHDGTLDLGDRSALVARGHPLALNRYRPANDAGNVAYFEPAAYWLVRTREHEVASFYPVVTPLLVAPLYAPAVLWLNAQGWEQPRVDRVAELMEKLAASLLAAIASVLLYLVLRREGQRWALPLALAFAFGTNTWMISSQALWQHGAGELLIALALWLALGPPGRGRLALLGAVCVLMAANRPPDALIAAAIGAFVLWRRWRDLAWLLAGALLPAALVVDYNLGFIGHLAGGYGVVKPPHNFFQSAGAGLAGLLFSPTRGLLIFTPFLVLVPAGLLRRLRESDTRVLAIALGLAIVGQLLLYALGDWRAGTSWGPRWLTDLLPLLVWLLAPAVPRLRPLARGAFVAAIALSIGVQAIGAFWYTKTSDELLYADGGSMRGAWDFGNVPFLTELRHAPAAGELLCDANGSIDLVGSSRIASADSVPELAPGAPIEGWALACSRSPAQVALLIDGVIVGTSAEFLRRADVDAALHTDALSGWRVTARLWGVAPGVRVLQLAVRVTPRGDFRIVRERRVSVRPELLASITAPAPTVDLEASATRAAALLRDHQTEYGAWLTAHTVGPRYDAPQSEMNTYLTSLLADLLAPLAQRHGLDDALTRARAHLAAQIESSGLVRYHGLPDAPTIGTLGCAITPDADDSALAWRVAGPRADDARRRNMLRTLAEYRDARGLYRTWLAPLKEYQCLDPGSDPDPTDLGIQMHVYLMLRELDPPAAQALCGAMRRAQRDDDVWVYYAKSALVPYLRTAELAQQGCALSAPIERLMLPARGQEIWSELAYRLVQAPAARDAAFRTDANHLLAQLAADDFGLLRVTPPLLYHNDLSATVRRYYWSQDVGYALWLRLRDAVAAAP